MADSTINEGRHLPLDVVSDILLRLPGKHVIRCKLLNKTYCELIETADFVKYYNDRNHSSSANNTNVILWPTSRCHRIEDQSMVSLLPSPSYVHVPHIPEYASFLYLVGSSNGLLCAVIKDCGKVNNFLLWNPSTRQHRILPQPKTTFEAFLGHHTLKYYQNAVGFAYHASTNDYKVVKIWRNCHRYLERSEHLADMEVWSMKTNRWKQIKFEEPINRGSLIGLHVKDCLHWLTRKLYDEIHTQPFVLTFDMTTDRFNTHIKFPEDLLAQLREGVVSLTGIMDCMGSLACNVSQIDDVGLTYDVWVMDSNNVWSKRFSVGPKPEETAPYFTRISIGGKFLMMRLEEGKSDQFLLYDPHSKEEEDLPYEPVVTGEDDYCVSFHCCSYIETLASPFMV